MSLTRKIVKLVEPGKFEIFEEELRSIKENELLVKIHSCGLCHSEMAMYRGELMRVQDFENNSMRVIMKEDVKYPFNFPEVSHYGFFYGHEPVGEIVEVGNTVKGFEVGDFVVGPKPGSFATYTIMDTYRLMKLPSEIKEQKYCLGEMLMCITNIVRAAQPAIGDKTAVIGCGGMGLLCVSGMAASSAFEIIAIDIDNYRLEWAGKIGATKTINPKEENVVKKVYEITDGKGVDIVIDITGRMAGFRTACEIIKESRGKILIPSFYALPEIFDFGRFLSAKCPIIHSVHPTYSLDYMEDLNRGVGAYMNGTLPLDKIITHKFKLEEINEAFKMLEHPDKSYLKGIIVP